MVLDSATSQAWIVRADGKQVVVDRVDHSYSDLDDQKEGTHLKKSWKAQAGGGWPVVSLFYQQGIKSTKQSKNLKGNGKGKNMKTIEVPVRSKIIHLSAVASCFHWPQPDGHSIKRKAMTSMKTKIIAMKAAPKQKTLQK